MGAYLSEPVTAKESSSGYGNRLGYGCSCMQGWRQGMEDAHITLPELGESGLALFGVFDGHGGREVALFCRDHVPNEVQRRLGISGGSCSSTSPPPLDTSTHVLGDTLRGTFHAIDTMLEQPEHQEEVLGHRGQKGDAGSAMQTAHGVLQASVQAELNQAKEKGALSREEVMQLMLKMNALKRLESQQTETVLRGLAADAVGCTAVCVLVSPTHYVCANAGDSRAVLCRAGRPVELSHDHKPNDECERRRIYAAGGTVQESQVGQGAHARTNYRVNGNLNLSRSIGDLQYKKRTDLPQDEQVICSTPDIVVEPRRPEDEFLVVACDGVWDVKTNEQVCEFVRGQLGAGRALSDLVEDLLNDCLAADPKATCGLGGDNMTCIVVKVNEDAVGELDDLSPALDVQKQDSETVKPPAGCFPFRCLR